MANGQPLPVLGTFRAAASLLKDQEPVTLAFTVTDVPKLNLLGRDAIVKLGVNVSALLGVSSTPGKGTILNLQSITDTKEPKPDEELQQACRKLCGEFTELFKPELGCLKDFQLEIKFKAESNPTFCKPRPVPFAILDDLNLAYDAGIAKGVWKPTHANSMHMELQLSRFVKRFYQVKLMASYEFVVIIQWLSMLSWKPTVIQFPFLKT